MYITDEVLNITRDPDFGTNTGEIPSGPGRVIRGTPEFDLRNSDVEMGRRTNASSSPQRSRHRPLPAMDEEEEDGVDLLLPPATLIFEIAKDSFFVFTSIMLQTKTRCFNITL